MKNLTRLVLLATLTLVPAIASARPVIVAHTHTDTVHDRGPQPHLRTVDAHR